MEKFEDMKMPEAEAPEDDVMELEFDEEVPAEEGADLSAFKDEELVAELEKRGFMVEEGEPVEEAAEEEVPEEEMM